MMPRMSRYYIHEHKDMGFCVMCKQHLFDAQVTRWYVYKGWASKRLAEYRKKEQENANASR